jgi:N-succinyldiaminopimelate aminotransferase
MVPLSRMQRRYVRLISQRRWMGLLSQRGEALASGGAAQVWETMNALAARPGMINMSQGFPDFEGSQVARSVAAELIASGGAADHQYSPQPGLLKLRESISSFYSRRYPSVAARPYDPSSEVVVTAGGQEGLAAAFLAFCDPGDEVVVCEPFYPFMLGAIRLAGAVPRVVRLRAPTFTIEEDELREACASPRAKMLVLNSPQNPTGHVATPAELDMCARACQEHDLVAIADEVYEHCVFSPHRHLRLADIDGMRQRTISISSGGKLFSLTGWRVAWATGPSHLVQPLGRAHTHMTFSAPTPLQAGIAAALDADDGLEEISPLFSANFESLAAALLKGTAVRRVGDAQGGYFLVAETDGSADVKFCKVLAEQSGVVATPLSVFYSTPFPDDEPCTLVRFTICKSREHVLRACAALTAPAGERSTTHF